MKEKIKYYLPEVIKGVINSIKSFPNWEGLKPKLQSELISHFWECSFAEIVPNVVAPFKDHLPDLYIDEKPLELKTSKTTTTWRGGEFSKRESDFLLIAWDEIDGEFHWFACFTHLKESDWKSSQSSSYYATTIDINYVLNLPTTEILMGSTKKKRIKEHIIF